MVRFLVIALAIFVLYKLFANDIKRKVQGNKQTDAKGEAKQAETGELTKDPVCGTYVSVADSITVRDGETLHHFCSYECRDTFLKKLEQGGREIPAKTPNSDEDDE